MVRHPRFLRISLIAFAVAVCLAPSMTAQGERFVPLGPVAEFAPDEVVRGRWQGVFAIADARLVRGAEHAAVETATGEATGTVHDLAADPAGPIFVAADRGLFVISRDVSHLDRVDSPALIAGEAVLSVHVDDDRRVWFLTPSRFGCCEAAYHHGRSFTVDDGLPAESWAGLRQESGALVLVTKDGRGFRYSPAKRTRREPVNVTAVNGLEPADAPVALEYGDELVLKVSGAAGLDLYSYVDDHQVLRPSSGETVVVREIPPGRHVVSVVGIDADLRRTRATKVTVDVAMPTYAKPAVLLGSIGGSVLLIFVGFLAWWRRRGGGRGALGRALLSATLCSVLGMQFVAALFPHGRGWPFVGYSMYTSTFDPLATTHRVDLRGIRPDGRFCGINAAGFDIAIDNRWQIMRPIIHGDRAARERLLERYNAKNPGAEVRGFQVVTRRYRLTDRGPRRVASLVLAHHDRGPR